MRCEHQIDLIKSLSSISQWYEVKQSNLKGSMQAPPSKSQTMRAILFATMAEGESFIHDYLPSPDTEAMLAACRQLGADITQTATCLKIKGTAGKPKLAEDVIDVGNSGQVLRFIAALSALSSDHTVFTGDHSIRTNRPLQPLIDALNALGGNCVSTKGDGYAPLIVKGPIQSGTITMNGADSQPVSAMLMVAAFMQGKTIIQVGEPGETPWILLTLSWLERFGIQYKRCGFEYYEVTGLSAPLPAFEYTVPADFSSMAFPVVAALLTQSEIELTGIDFNDAQGDKIFLELLESMGAKFSYSDNTLRVHQGHSLVGRELDMNACIDMLPIFAVVGCFAKGETILKNAAIARKKESDRLATITQTLRKMGASIDEHDDHLIVQQSQLHSATVYSYEDHRIAMALTIAGFAADGGVNVMGTACVAKSYKQFVSDLTVLGAYVDSNCKPKTIFLFGFKSAGKTTLARTLSEQLGIAYLDTDDLIVQQVFADKDKRLTAAEIVNHYGEPYFRSIEQRVVESLDLADPAVVALGGGTLMNKENYQLLKSKGLLVLVDTDYNIIESRLFAQENLPTFIDPNDPSASLKAHYQTRMPVYRSYADFSICTNELSERQKTF